MLERIYYIALRECRIMWHSTIYRFCILPFPVLVVIFFTSLMHEGVPTDLPVGIVDLDHTALSRNLERELDMMQTSHVVAHYNSVNEARQACQQNKIYGFLYIPSGTTDQLLANRGPNISFYYNNVPLAAGSMTFRDMKTATTLAAAAVGVTKLAALGLSEEQIKNNLQPITVDLHMVGNPYGSYNIYLSTFVIPGVLMLFVFLLVPYAIWTEVKFNRAHEWIQMAGGNMYIALFGKLLPHTIMFITVFLGFEFYIYGTLDFPHPGGIVPILLLGILSVLACQGFGIFVSGLIASLRMSMSVCSLWAVVSFSMCGATFPVETMDPMLRSMSLLFPLRHYIIIYQRCIFHGFPLSYAWPYIAALIIFAVLPLLMLRRLKQEMLHYQYLP